MLLSLMFVDGESNGRVGDSNSMREEQFVDTLLFIRRNVLMEFILESQRGGLSVARVCFLASNEDL